MKKYIAFLLVLIALFLCACQTENTKKLESANSGSTGSTGGEEGGAEADVIDAKVSFAVENDDIEVTLTNGTLASVSRTVVNQDVAAEESVTMTLNYQYDGIFLEEDNTYTLLLTSCKVSAELECANKEAVVTALLALLEAAEVEDTVYTSYEKLFAGETCDAADLEGFESETWILALKDGELTAVEMFDAEVALTDSIEFYADNCVKSYIQYDNAAGTYEVREYNENGDPTFVAAHGVGGAVAEKTEYEYFESGALKGLKRYFGVALDYECEYDEEGNILSERDYGAENEGNSDIFHEGDELPEEDEEMEEIEEEEEEEA